MGAHARFSPSAANRLIHCPTSLVLGEAFQEEESPYAAEGSAGHALAEHLIKKHLKKNRPAARYPITIPMTCWKRWTITSVL